MTSDYVVQMFYFNVYKQANINIATRAWASYSTADNLSNAKPAVQQRHPGD